MQVGQATIKLCKLRLCIGLMDALTATITAANRVVLSVGSGDGSQQLAILKSGHNKIVSTFFDSEQDVISKYGTARDNIEQLRKSSTVLFGVDATKLHTHPDLKKKRFDIILFTFPHTGVSNFAAGHKGPNPECIDSNKRLIRDFLKSAQHMIVNDGEINITLKTSSPYDKWSFPDFSNYEIHPKSQHNFNAQLFPGYVHKSTLGHLSKVNNGNARTYVFSKKIKEVGGDNFCPSTPFTMSIQLCAVNDEDIREMVMEILKSLQDSASNVLDIRRQFPEALRSDTRQLNRVLYEMEASNKVMRVPPKKCNQKPTWSLSTM